MNVSFRVDDKFLQIIDITMEKAIESNHAFITPEHILLVMAKHSSFKKAYVELGGDIEKLKSLLSNYIDKYTEPLEKNDNPYLSTVLVEILNESTAMHEMLGSAYISIFHFLTVLTSFIDVYARYYLLNNAPDVDLVELVQKISSSMGCKETPSPEEIEDSIRNNIKKSISENNHSSKGNSNHNWKNLVSCLNDEVEKDDYIPLVGREQELKDTIAILLRKDKNNPIHIGDAGVGKTAITKGLAKLINDKKVPESLLDHKIYSCNMGDVIAGSSFMGEFEQKLKTILEGVAQEKAILYIDEIHTITKAGSNSSIGASNMLKPYLTQGDIKIIGATTVEEYRKSIEDDSALERRFSPILIKEPSKEETFEILNSIKDYYERFHMCLYSDEIIRTIIQLSSKHMNDKFFPDKAIDILDEAGAYIELNNFENRIVTNDIIEEIISKKCNIPRNTVSSNETIKIKELGTKMKEIVIGQDSAIDKINENIILARSGLRDNDKPVSNLLFVGPTGVGKTFIAQTLADSLGIPLIRKDMSEFTESHSVSKLYGSPAGYVGYDEGGLLINEIRKTPYCVLLLDEIEKAHPDVYNVLLQVMDNAKLTDSFGKSADFRNVILIMTSNAGAEDSDKLGIGFNPTSTNTIDKSVNSTFRPEFRNRLDAIVKFNAMSKEMAQKIATNQLKTLSTLLSEKNVSLSYDDNVIEYIVKNGYSKEYGARNIKRTIDNNIKIKLGNEILFGKLKEGGNCRLISTDSTIDIIKE